MLKEFKHSYSTYRWLRYLIWSGLLALAMLLVWSLHWALYARTMSYPFLLVALASTLWSLACILFFWLSFTLIRYHFRQWHILNQHQLYHWQELRNAAQNTHTDDLYQPPLPLAVSVAGASRQTSQVETIADPIAGLRLPQRPLSTQDAHQSSAQSGRRASNMQGGSTPGSFPAFVPPANVSTTAQFGSHPAFSPPPSLQPASRHTRFAKIGVGWDPGIKRRHQPNEDGLAAIQGTCTHKDLLIPFDLFIVADGMGGHANGQEASRLAIQTMAHIILRNLVASNEINPTLLTNILTHSVQQANQVILQRNQELNSDMGTTLTAALVINGQAYVVNVGDSRTYLYRHGQGLGQITRDHSLVARLVANGVITPDEIYTHPGRNLVERGLGDKPTIEVDSFLVGLCKGDWLLLCSDGLWEMVRDSEIAHIMSISKNSNPEEISDLLVQAALDGGGHDNISVIVAQVL
jgi:serine/threonine protein phosphatase PrpC